MKHPWPRSIIVLIIVQGLCAQMRVDNVANLASRMPSRLPGGSLSPGGIITVTGTGLSLDTASHLFPTYLFSESLLGVTLTLVTSSGETPVNPISVSPTDIVAWLPDSAPLGNARLRIRSASVNQIAEVPVVVGRGFGLFAANGSNYGPGVIIRGDSTLVSVLRPVSPGETVYFLAGGVAPDMLVIGDQKAAIKSKATLLPGITLLAVTVPNVTGCYVPVHSESPTQGNYVTIPVGDAGGTCTGPGILPSELANWARRDGRRLGRLQVTDFSLRTFPNLLTQSRSKSSYTLYVEWDRNLTQDEFASLAGYGLGCVVQSRSLAQSASEPLLASAPLRDLGSWLLLAHPASGQSLLMSRVAGLNVYRGGIYQVPRTAGQWTIEGEMSPKIQFSTTNVINPFNVTAAPVTVSPEGTIRTDRDLTVKLMGSPDWSMRTLTASLSVDSGSTNSATTATCTVDAAKSDSVTFPSGILRQLPNSESRLGVETGVLTIVTQPYFPDSVSTDLTFSPVTTLVGVEYTNVKVLNP